MNQDEPLATALRGAAAAVPVGTAPTSAVIRRGKTMRRRRTALRSAVVAAAILVPAGGVLFAATSGPVPAPPLPVASAPASAPVRVVDPGEELPLGRGNTMTLTDQGMSLVTPGVSGAEEKSTEVGEAPGGISATVATDDTGTLWAGIHRGPEPPARVTVAAGGRTTTARTVTLPGRPGWFAFYADDARGSTDDFTITVQGSDGAILDTLTKSGKG
ncbi:hypothetical protein OG875_12545 [Streptomyces sp. NBC_01498]|uniref:hypothetical protein n=1 Tax=Streptomyces sp. NBC_01498 TaxID=2975870 RepID=UPI002E7B17B5|nr:hypothetical protein [Streptomyces sp. NBC_01498]WTL25346.1 hypothetical protein OG875_12545 [Streptomyces sp. NBC_01498]